MELRPDLAQIAASVARALDLGGTYKVSKSEGGPPVAYWDRQNPISDRHYLEADGSNLTDPYWQCRCRDWLVAQGYAVEFGGDAIVHKETRAGCDGVQIDCPDAEFAARAIHEIMSRG